MKTCSYSGKQYSDDVELCPVDQHPVGHAGPPVIPIPLTKQLEPVRRFVLPVVLAVIAAIVLAGAGLWGIRYVLFDRPVLEKIKSGKAMVRAIEEFKKENGTYPARWSDIIPKYLPATTTAIDESNGFQYFGWSYQPDGAASYRLFYYWGHGGVGYDPPVWYEEFDGHRRPVRTRD